MKDTQQWITNELCSRPEFYDERIPDTVDLAEFIHKGYNSFSSSDKS